MPNPPIPPALTPEEWEFLCYADVPEAAPDCNRVSVDVHAGILSIELHDDPYDKGHWILRDRIDPLRRHALAALCLYHQAFGFTEEDVALVRRDHHEDCSMWWLSDYPGAQSCNCGWLYKLEQLADKIAALLPPQDSVLSVPQNPVD